MFKSSYCALKNLRQCRSVSILGFKSVCWGGELKGFALKAKSRNSRSGKTLNGFCIELPGKFAGVCLVLASGISLPSSCG